MKRLAPWLIGLFALALRLWGINWGLPNADHLYSYHTDETMVLSGSLNCHPLLFLLDPKFYPYGCLVPNINGFFLDLGSWTGLVKSATDSSALLTCRLVTVLFGALTCPVLFFAGRRFFSENAGYVAAALYAIAPLAVQHAHFATVDVHATFWVALCLLATAAPMHANTDGKRRFRPDGLFWAGVFAGLAAAAKYNIGIVILAPLVAAFLSTLPDSTPNSSSKLKPIALVIGGALMGFLFGSPALFTNPGEMVKGLLDEIAKSRTDHGGVFAGLPPAFLTHSLQSVWTLGLLLPIVIAVALVLTLRRRSRTDWILLAFLVPYFLMIGFSNAMYARYTLPLMPALFLLAGALAENKRNIGLIGIAALPSLIMSGLFNIEMVKPDTRDTALTWIREQKFSRIEFPTGPWHYHPPLVPELTHPRPDKAKEAAAATPNLIPAEGEWNLSFPEDSSIDALIVSETEYARVLRLASSPAKTKLGSLESSSKDGSLKKQTWSSGIVVIDQGYPVHPFLPYDMGYVSPSIVVFSRR